MTLHMTTIQPAELHNEMARLRRDEGMDYLVSLTGMDWGRRGAGRDYQLENSRTGQRTALKTATTDRQAPYLPVCRICGTWRSRMSARCLTFSASALRATPTCAACFCARTGWATPCARMRPAGPEPPAHDQRALG